ncbi:HD-GYP domain-containing protein [Kosmotoga pacifica]|nr:HD-GYP domain-containing protein [Kosmotoga pacifica]
MLKKADRLAIYRGFIIFFLSFALSLCGFYYLNRARLVESVDTSGRYVELSVNLIADKLSSGYFQWTAFYTAVLKNDTEFIEEFFQEILDGTPYVKDIELIDRPEWFSERESEKEIYRISSKEGVLYVLFNIYDDFLEVVAPEKVVKAIIDVAPILTGYGFDGGAVELSNTGSPYVYGLNYRIVKVRLGLIHYFSAFVISLLVVLAVEFLIASQMYHHYHGSGLENIVALFEQRDAYTANHSRKVATLATYIGKKCGLKRRDLRVLKNAALLHDIGKISVPESILNKKGKLSDEEFEVIKKHPVISANVIENISQLKELIPVVLYHHERLDGSGYPAGLKNDEIPLLSRILAVADVFDALTSDRAYRSALDPEVAIKVMKNMPIDRFFLMIIEENLYEIVEILKFEGERKDYGKRRVSA